MHCIPKEHVSVCGFAFWGVSLETQHLDGSSDFFKKMTIPRVVNLTAGRQAGEEGASW